MQKNSGSRNEQLTQESPSVSDEDLARQAQAGSLDAFEQLVYLYEQRIHAFVLQLCRNRTDACEITQDTFVKAFQSLEQFDSRRNFAAWIFTIARRKCVDRHRSAHRESDAAIPELADESDPAKIAATREEGQNLWQLARQRLTRNQFQALWLHYAVDMDVAQIAQALGKTSVHIKVLLFRARQVLARELKRGAMPGEIGPFEGSKCAFTPNFQPGFIYNSGKAMRRTL